MLDQDQRPPAAVAQRVIANTLKVCYREVALLYARGAVAMLALSLILPASA
jgi:hypothetical protein